MEREVRIIEQYCVHAQPGDRHSVAKLQKRDFLFSGIQTVLLFFFKQKTAYEIMPSLVGSEMCIRDSADETRDVAFAEGRRAVPDTHLTLPTKA